MNINEMKLKMLIKEQIRQAIHEVEAEAETEAKKYWIEKKYPEIWDVLTFPEVQEDLDLLEPVPDPDSEGEYLDVNYATLENPEELEKVVFLKKIRDERDLRNTLAKWIDDNQMIKDFFFDLEMNSAKFMTGRVKPGKARGAEPLSKHIRFKGKNALAQRQRDVASKLQGKARFANKPGPGDTTKDVNKYTGGSF